MKVSVITPWLNHPELAKAYFASMKGAEIVIIDNGSEKWHADYLLNMIGESGGVLIRNEKNLGYATACNQGLETATGDVLLCINNDVEATSKDFIRRISEDVLPDGLYGPSLLNKHGWDYLEGWCIAAHRDVWKKLGGFDDQYYTGLYWEDNDLSFRALKAGLKLTRTNWPIWHMSNVTSSSIAGAYDHSQENEKRFLARIKGDAPRSN